MCAWTKSPEYHKRYCAKEMAAAIGVYENLKYNLPQCRYVSHLLLLLLFVSYYYNRYCVYSFFCHGYTFKKIFFRSILQHYFSSTFQRTNSVLLSQQISISQISTTINRLVFLHTVANWTFYFLLYIYLLLLHVSFLISFSCMNEWS